MIPLAVWQAPGRALALPAPRDRRQRSAGTNLVAVTPRRQQILDIAADLFATRGFHGVSVAELGAACGISGPAQSRDRPATSTRTRTRSPTSSR